MAGNKKRSRYGNAVTNAWRVLRLLIYVLVLLLILFAGRAAYRFGYLLFDESTMAEEGEGQDVTIVVSEDDSVYDIGEILTENGLIEHPLIFTVQERLSDYHGELQPGTYILNTEETVDEMLEILAKVNTDGQPSDEETEESGESSDGTERTDGTSEETESTDTGETEEGGAAS